MNQSFVLNEKYVNYCYKQEKSHRFIVKNACYRTFIFCRSYQNPNRNKLSLKQE